MMQLLVPREDALFVPSHGKLHPLRRRGIFRRHDLPNIFSESLTKLLTDEKSSTNGRIRGKHSGVRSGLILNNGNMYKLKGCAPTTEEYDGEPFGGQVISKVERELEATQEIARVMEMHGLHVPYRPLGYFRYPLSFRGETLACSIMEAIGDTRLDELMLELESGIMIFYRDNDIVMYPGFVNELGDIFYKFGQLAGRLKRLMDEENMVWSASSLEGGRTNAHLGNYVVFIEDGKLQLGIVDLDDCFFPFQDEQLMSNEYNNLITNALDSVAVSTNMRVKVPDGIEFSLEYRYRFVEGFETAYANVEAVPIDLAEISTTREAILRARRELEGKARDLHVKPKIGSYRTYLDSSQYLRSLYGNKINNPNDYNISLKPYISRIDDYK